jgi:hypothetical protein
MIRFHPRIFAAATAILLALTSGRAETPAATELTVHIGPSIEITHSHRYCWFPTVHQFASGEIMVTMRMSPDEINPEGDFSAVAFSKDGGKTWSHRYTMGAGANVDGAYSDAPQADGTIWNLYGWVGLPEGGGNGKDFPATLTKHSRGGLEFTQIRDASFHLTEAVSTTPTQLYAKDYRDAYLLAVPGVNPFGPILPSLDGGWIAPIEFKLVGAKYTRVGLIHSLDGKSWTQISTVATAEANGKKLPWVGDEGPDESSLVRLADHRLYSLFRTGNHGYLGQAWSADDGKTWTAPTSTGFKGVAPKLRRLSNGVLACTYGRPGPVSIMFSLDGTGRTWTHLTPIFSGMSTRYTDFIEVQPGHILVVYDSVPYGWDPIPEADTTSLNRVCATWVDVERK